MTYEFKKILRAYKKALSRKKKSVLASVVHLNGSSYRRPGVRMLIDEDGIMTGAVSGGCVEKEILRQSASVFSKGIAKVITYDGRYRLGCDGEIFILIEPFRPSQELMQEIEKCFKERKAFSIKSQFKTEFSEDENYGSEIVSDDKSYSIRQGDGVVYITDYEIFEQVLEPVFKLTIIGGEYDQNYLTDTASGLGWEVDIILSHSDPRTINDFPKATNIHHFSASDLMESDFPKNSAVVLMTHNYARDLEFLKVLSHKEPMDYLGILGSVKRREKLLNDLTEHNPDVSELFLSKIYAPAGLDLGAEMPEEVALSICAEILSVIRKKEPESLKHKSGSIH